ncbi:MAG: insulinase family protein [Ignavibacteriaceae bacterium]|nr:insulinase family protein [Ignavibacteriaceae bacterium]
MNILKRSYVKYKLRNGLEVILSKSNGIPLVSVNIWYKTGSANDPEMKTGLAHLFEHMMFQGSQNIEKQMHFKYIQEAGGTLNGSTSFDRTNYFEKVPSNFLELVLWLEADRMGFLLPALTQEKLDNQIDVVRNERLERYDNQPYGLAWELLISNIYPEKHPYHSSTIGSIEHISSFNLEDVKNFFKKYYSPSNASLVICGEFDIESAKYWVEKYFGDLESSENNTEPDIKNFNLTETKEIIHEDNVQLERLYLAWPTTTIFSRHDSAYEILADILSGSKDSRISKKLVFEKEIAQDVSSFQYSGKYGGHFMIVATAKPGISLNQIKDEIFAELNKAASGEISLKEITKTKNGIKSSFIYSMQNIDTIADHLNSYNFYLSEPDSFLYDLMRYESVTPDDLIQTASSLVNSSFVELRITPKG